MKIRFIAIALTFGLFISACVSKQLVLEEMTTTKNEIAENTEKKIKEAVGKIEIKMKELQAMVKELSRDAGEAKTEMIKGLKLEKERLKRKLSQIETSINKLSSGDSESPEKEEALKKMPASDLEVEN